VGKKTIAPNASQNRYTEKLAFFSIFLLEEIVTLIFEVYWISLSQNILK